MPLSYYFFGTVIQFGMTLMVRFAYRFVLLERSKRRKTEEIAKAKRVLLIGGGKAGQIILRDIKTAKELKDIVCCIIDDNPNGEGTSKGCRLSAVGTISYRVWNAIRSTRSL